MPDLLKFYHATLGSPTLSTLQTALEKNLLPGFPGLTVKALKKYPPQSIAMHKGHLDQTRKNIQSTQPPTPKTDEEILLPHPVTSNQVNHFCYATIWDPEKDSGQIHTDQTGPFPVTSNRGNKLVFIMFTEDASYIKPIAIKSKAAENILGAYQIAHAELVKAGIKPKLQRLDNECSQILKDYMHEKEVDFQLAPPGMHRRNAAERAIRTFKNHFIAILSSTDPNFPLNLWCRLLPQAEITINLLRPSRMNPKHSAWSQIHGHFNFNRTPIAPLGTKVLVHEKPQNRASWDPHRVEGWYIGPALESYRCFKTYIPKTRAERITDTVAWLPHYLKFPLNPTWISWWPLQRIS